METNTIQSSERKGKTLARVGTIGFIASVLVALAPLLMTLIAGLIADSLGCRLDESGSYPCLVGGVDIGELLSLLGVMGWLSLVTIPFGALAGLIFAILALIGWSRHALKRSKEEATVTGKALRLLFPLLGVALLLAGIVWFFAFF